MPFSFIPKSSFWRTTGLIWLVLILSQISLLWFAIVFLYLPGIKQSAKLVALEVDTLHVLVDSQQKNELLNRLKQQHELEITENMALVPPLDDGLLRDFFLEPLQARIGANAKVRLSFLPAPSLWVNTDRLGALWVRFPLESVGRYEVFIVLTWIIGTPVAAFILAYWFVGQLNRPLQRLETAARKLGRGENIRGLLSGNTPREIQAVNEAFLQMHDNLKRMDRERALLLAGISHDLRTPLTRLRLTAELLGESEFAEGMIRDIEDMNAILDQFILFVRDGSDERAELGDLNEVILEVISQFESEGVTIQTELHPLSEISLKRLSIKRLFSNLIANAIGHGGGEVTVYSAIEDGEICVIIGDRGPGLTPQQQYDLFQPFARGDQSRTSKGSGLGLAIVKRIVDMHHGRVIMRNREAGGLEVVVYLPVTGNLIPPDSMLARIH